MSEETRRKWIAIAVFYIVAVAIRYIALCIGMTEFNTLRYWMVGWMEGIGPCLGALVAVLVLRRKFYCSLTGTSVIRSILSVVLPFLLCFFLHRELSFILLGFIF